VSIQSPFAVLLDELVEVCGGGGGGEAVGATAPSSGGSDGTGASGAAAVGSLGRADALRAIELLLSHVERRLASALEAAGEDSDDEGADSDGDTPSAKRQRGADDVAESVLGSSSSSAGGERPALDRLQVVLAQAGVDALYPPTEGVGLFAGIANLNHSCRPNAVVVFERDSTATVAALRAIGAGEEVMICYIEEEQSLAARKADLVDYGFVCGCERCVEET
jgi:hypothetical protein